MTQPVIAPSGYWGSVSGGRIVSGSLSMPLYGAWVADVVLATDAAIPSSVTVQVGNLALKGTVYRQIQFAGLREARIVAGAGGWSKSVQARGYNNPGGVLRSRVLQDAATEVGESVKVASDSTVGTNYARIGDSPTMPGKAGRVLRSLAGPQWWIDNNGVTQVGPRPSSNISSAFTVEEFSGTSGTLRIATEDPASWLPGNTFSSATVAQQTIGSVRHSFTDQGVARLEVMTSTTNDRWLEDVREIVRQEISASLPYAMQYEYVVTASTGATLDALPADPTRGAPPLTGVPYRGGVPGGSATFAPGAHVAIGFLDANPAKPVIMGAFDGSAPILEGIFATLLQLGDSSAVPLTPSQATAAIIVGLNALGAAFQALTAQTILLPGTWNTIGGALITALLPIATGPVATTKVFAK